MEHDLTLCIKKEHLPKEWIRDTFYEPVSQLTIKDIFKDKWIWVSRKIAENRADFKQIIPYLLIRIPDGHFACYQRKGNEKRLHGLWSAGVGGHIDLADQQQSGQSIFDILENCAYRELREEFQHPLAERLTYVGIINEERTKVGRVHTGLVYLVELKKPALPNAELHNLKWITTHEIRNRKVELWTELAIRLLTQQKH